MEISIIIASHNEGTALTSTLESCVDTCAGADYEIVVADDASTDRSVDIAQQRFPLARFVRHPQRAGASPTKALGAAHARGDVLVFLDAHTRPEPGAITRLAQLVTSVREPAIITPAIAALNTESWRADHSQVGHGYAMDLSEFDTEWIPLSQMRRVDTQAGPLFESPALIGCAFAISRTLYDRLWGFDAHMRSWGLEDLDLGFKCWQAGHSILHDPDVIIAHRFQSAFTHYTVPPEHVLANKMRMARKNFTEATWDAWAAHQRVANGGPLAGHPEGLWAHAWQLLVRGGASLEQEREFLQGHRGRDEFGFAARFGLDWPLLRGYWDDGSWINVPSPSPHPSRRPSPSPSPPPPMVEIQVNNTPETNDDLVVLPCLDPQRNPTPVPCQTRLTSDSADPVTVTLTDPTGRLQFLPDAGGTAGASITLTLPADKSFVGFRIVGQAASDAIGDATIRATRDDGTVLGTKPVTVVRVAGSITLDVGGPYDLVGNMLMVKQFPPIAMFYTASALVQPDGVDCGAPQLAFIKTLKFGFMQNDANLVETVSYANPTVQFNADVPVGTVAIVPVTVTTTTVFASPPPLNDNVMKKPTDPDPFPMYTTSSASLGTIGCNQNPPPSVGANDGPGGMIELAVALPAKDANGAVVGQATWSFVNVERLEQFVTFCASVDNTSAATRLDTFCAVAQASWELNLNIPGSATNPARRTPTITQQNAPAVTAPVAVPPTANRSDLTVTTRAFGTKQIPKQ